MRNRSLSLLLGALFIFSTATLPAQELKINELMSSNTETLYDEDGDTPDWLELNNFGNAPVDLGDYFLSDDREALQKWALPEVILGADQQFLVLASDKNRQQIPVNWYTLIDQGAEWQYLVPNQAVPANWASAAFDDSSWVSGSSGFGYGDGDDATIVPSGISSIYLRKTFTIDHLQGLQGMWLHLDYDDAFVAYLNGVEIARANIGTAGTPVAYTQFSDSDHEAVMYQGYAPDAFEVSSMIPLLQNGENVLAIQVHNFGTTSSDLTAIPFLTVGYDHPVVGLDPLSGFVNLTNLYPHTNFKLSADGETVYLSHGALGVVDSLAFGAIPANHSFGRKIDDPATLVYFVQSTPGQPNGSIAYSGIVQSEVQFSITNTFLTAPQNLSLSGAAADEIIRFTLDGEAPTESSPEYLNPVFITTNTVVRARIFKPGLLPGRKSGRTYLFDQPHDLPVVTINTATANLWDHETGIYAFGDDYDPNFPYFGANFWEDWERPAQVDMIDPSGERLFSLSAGIKIFGGWSRANDQKSLSIFLGNEYGDEEINYPLFADKPISNFKSIVLRNSGNEWNRSMLRDGMMTSLVRNLDIDRAAYRPAVMYLNGEYWGIHNIREKINEDFLEANHGYAADQIDELELYGAVVEGSDADYWDLLNFLETQNLALDANLEIAASQMDMSNFMDYEIAQIYFDNTDWPGNNIKFWRPQIQGGKWRWILYDTDFGYGLFNPFGFANNTLEFATATNGPDWPNPPWSTFILRTLLENTGFQHAFINRFADLLNTTFKSEKVVTHINNLAQAIESEMPRHLARWSSINIGDWYQEITNLRGFANMRVNHVRNHIQDKFSLPQQHEITLQIVTPDAGSIRLNTLSIHENNWTGVYFEAVPIQLTAQPYPGFIFDHWIVDGATYLTPGIELNLLQNADITVYYLQSMEVTPPIVINEINYNSPDNPDAGDWVELFNPSSESIDLSGWVFKDDDDSHTYVLPESTILAASSYLVLCQKVDNFSEVHPTVTNFIGEFDFGLSSSGDDIRLYDHLGALVDSVTYGVVSPWPPAPNGTGATLELIHYSLDNSLPESWKKGLINLGTPGQGNSVVTGLDTPLTGTVERSLKIYPNPFGQDTHIRLENIFHETLNLRIFNLAGQEVFSTHSQSGEFQWNGANNAGNPLPGGIYICKVWAGAQAYVGKVVLKR